MRYHGTDMGELFYFNGYGDDGVTIAVNLKTVAVDVKIPELSYPDFEERANFVSELDQINTSLTFMDESYFSDCRLSQPHKAVKFTKQKCQKDKTTERRLSLTRTAHLVAIFNAQHIRRQRRMRRSQPTVPSSNGNRLEMDDGKENLYENKNVCRKFIPKKVFREQNGAIAELKVITNSQENYLSLHFNRMSLFDSRENAISSMNSAEAITEVENQKNFGDICYPQASEFSISSLIGGLRNNEENFTEMHIDN